MMLGGQGHLFPGDNNAGIRGQVGTLCMGLISYEIELQGPPMLLWMSVDL